MLGSDVESGITYEVIVHFGTLVSIIYYYRDELGAFMYKWITFFIESCQGKREQGGTFSVMILIHDTCFYSWFYLKDQVESIFSNPLLVSIMLLITGGLLFSTKFVSSKTQVDKPSDESSERSKSSIGIAKKFCNWACRHAL